MKKHWIGVVKDWYVDVYEEDVHEEKDGRFRVIMSNPETMEEREPVIVDGDEAQEIIERSHAHVANYKGCVHDPFGGEEDPAKWYKTPVLA